MYQRSGFFYGSRSSGLATNGENDQGMLAKIIRSDTENQMAIVVNFFRSSVWYFVFIEPIVSTTIATIIITLCSIPKKRICR